MPLFLSEEEFNQCSRDPYLIAEKADSFIKDLHRQLETLKAQADAASITAEQTCALLEQKYISLSSEYAKLESQISHLNLTIEQRNSELAQVQSEKHQISILSISKDGEIERLSVEASELQKSKRQLLELVEQKDLEISEKNSTIKSYLDKIVNLTDDAALKQAHLHDKEAELARSLAACTRLSQEKELFERHNTWLNEELTTKVGNLSELRRTHTQVEADMSSKLADIERQLSECSSSLKWSKERLKEVELELTSAQEELCSSKEVAAANEERLSAELSTVTKLVDLYKESSQEWSRKAGDLEGVVKALEKHLNTKENEFKEKLEKELSARKRFEQEAAELKERLEKCEAEIEKNRKADELCLLPISRFSEEICNPSTRVDEVHENNQMLVPLIPTGVSGTALAASLLRDGWSLAKMYEKYQEAVDALRHERLGRKQAEAILERVLFEIEEKAGVILDERAEHERMMDAYSVMSQKLQQSLSEQANMQTTIQELKADVRRREREHDVVQREVVDLQKQVTVLLKECRDIQLRCGSAVNLRSDEVSSSSDIEMNDESDVERVISERLLTFRDINGLIEQNVQLRSLVRSLSDQNAKRDTELREGFEVELQKHTDEAAAKVAAVLKRAEEQGQMIESLHSSVAMYKRLYEEEQKLHGSYSHPSEAVPEIRRKDFLLFLEGSQDASKKAQEDATQRVKNLQEELEKSRCEVISIRLERDKMAMEANFARDKLDRYMKEFDHQRAEVNGVLARNVEFSQLIVDYQRKLRESTDSLHAAEEISRKLTVEMSLLKQEKELLVNSEKRAYDEVRSLSERVHRLQASLDTIHSTDEVREEARAMEKRKREEYLQQLEREWAQAKKELQEERDNVRTLTLDRENTIKNALRQVEEMGKKLGDALHNVAAAETRAAVAEARCSDFEKVKSSQAKVSTGGDGLDPSSSTDEVAADLLKAKDEIGKLKEEAKANKDHMLQYKSIAEVNEAAMKQIESAHEKFKDEAEKLKKSYEAEILSLQERVSELESDLISRSKEAASAVSGKEEALDSALGEISRLKEENSVKVSQVMGLEMQISSLKEDLEKEHQRWRTAQDNYERQVVLQSDTIQELTKTSQALAALQEEVSTLRKFADSKKSECDILKDRMETEKSMLEHAKNEAEKKYNEINEQNKILHNRLEALHINRAEKDRRSFGTSGNAGSDLQGDGELQTVVSYLRRSKEIAETEISLLKQEKLRLQSQLESALKASDTSQSLLHAERDKSRTLLLNDEEFRSLQIQVRETNLLRESNLQLREENKHNFEECQKLREAAQKSIVETESLATLLREKQIEVDAYKKEIEMQRLEKGNLENQIEEILRKSKSVDLESYDRMKGEFQQIQVKIREVEAKLEESARIVSEKQDAISYLEQNNASTRSELNEREKRIGEILQAETALKLDLEKQRKVAVNLKKRVDNLTKDKEELNKDRQSLSKQLEELKQGNKRPAGDPSNEQILKEKEKDTRIQILEKVIEKERESLQKERDENKKEKLKRLKIEKIVWDRLNTVKQEKDKLVEESEKYKQKVERYIHEVEKYKLAKDNLPESLGIVPHHPSETALDDQTEAFELAIENLNSTVIDEVGGRTTTETLSLTDTSSPATAYQAPPQAVTVQPTVGRISGPKQTKLIDDREKMSNLSKPEGRKTGRKLIRPRIEPSGDAEMSEIDGPSNAEGKSVCSLDIESHGELSLPLQTFARKRLASSSGNELQESQAQPETFPPVSKKLRGSDTPHENAEREPVLPQVKTEQLSMLDTSFEAAADQSDVANEPVNDNAMHEAYTAVKQTEESKESPLDETGDGETLKEVNDVSEESLDNEITDEGLKDVERQDAHQTESDVGSDREEGELLPDAIEHDGEDVSVMVASPEQEDANQEAAAVFDLPTSGEEGAVVSISGDGAEAMSSEIFVNEKDDMAEGIQEMADDLEKSNNDQEVADTESLKPIFSAAGSSSPSNPIGSSSPSNPAGPTVSKQGSHVSDVEESKEVLPVEKSTTINLSERAKERSELRKAGQTHEGIQTTRTTRRGGRYAGSTPRIRGRGMRGGRGQASDDRDER